MEESIKSYIGGIPKYPKNRLMKDNHLIGDRLRSISNINYKDLDNKSNLNESILNKSFDIVYDNFKKLANLVQNMRRRT